MRVPPVERSVADLAVEVARAAGDLLLSRFGGPARGVATKSSRTDMVSDADRDAEALIERMLADARPDDGLLAEEGSSREGRGGLLWIVDPLDGTTNFLMGIPHWCVAVAVADADGTCVGVVADPCRGEVFRAVRGAGATLNGVPLRLDGSPPLAEALVATGFNYLRDERVRQAARVGGLLPDVRDIRRFGAAALDLAWLAAGRFDAYYETGLRPWDWEAGALCVVEAGGQAERFPGADGGLPLVVAARASLFDAVRARVV
jgi:myo-inositol-1(or 4)-monophosphatase